MEYQIFNLTDCLSGLPEEVCEGSGLGAQVTKT